MNKEKRILFIHNTAADYRIPFFKMLSCKLNVKYFFTKMYLNERVYGNKQEKEKLNGINYVIVNNKLNIAVGLIKLMIKEEFDVVIMPTMDGILESLDAIIVFIIAKLRKKKIVYFWEKWEAPDNCLALKYRLKNLIKRISVKYILRNIDLDMAPGKKTLEYFLKLGIKREKIFLVSDASEVQRSKKNFELKKQYNISENKKVILYYGRIVKIKGLDYLIKAFYNLKKEYSDVYLLICGDGEFKSECIELAKSLNITDISFIGKVSPEDREIYFSQCDIFVLPSRFYNGHVDAWGLTVNEAMQFGKPVISTNAVGAAFDMIIDGVNGFTVEQANECELYIALRRIISDNDLYYKMCHNSKNTIKKSFNYNCMVSLFCEAIYSIK